MSMNTQYPRGAFADGCDDHDSGFRIFDNPFNPITESAEFMAWHAGYVYSATRADANPESYDSMLEYHDSQRCEDDIEPENEFAYAAGLKAFEWDMTCADNPFSRTTDNDNHLAFKAAIRDSLAEERNFQRASARKLLTTEKLAPSA